MQRIDDEEETPRTSKVRERAVAFHRWMKLADYEGVRSRAVRAEIVLYRFVCLLIEGMLRNELPRRAAALTYTTILSIFPLIAIVSFTASFFYTDEKEQQFTGWIQNQLLPAMEVEEIAREMTPEEAALMERQQAFSQNVEAVFTSVSVKFRENATTVGVFGFIGLLLTSGILYWSIETTVNKMWQTEHRIRWTTTLTNFITILVLAPIIISLSITGTGLVVAFLGGGEPPQAVDPAGEVQPASSGDAVVNVLADGATTPTVRESSALLRRVDVEAAELPPWLERLRRFTSAFGFLLPVFPVLINALVLAAAYSFIPRTQVHFGWALIGGLATAVCWEIARYGFFVYIYSSFINRTLADALGVMVIFLLWIYITWIILLMGCLTVYICQNFSALWSEKLVGEQMLLDGRLMVALMVLLARRFQSERGGGMTEQEIRRMLGLSQEHFLKLIDPLFRSQHVVLLENESLQIARPAQRIRVDDLLRLGCDISTLPVARRSTGAVGQLFGWLQEKNLRLADDATLASLIEDERFRAGNGEGE